MKIKSIAPLILCVLLSATLLPAATDVTSQAVHDRLIAGDTLLILDVREWSEYIGGHIAEPAGHLPSTPACMPWSSNVLQTNFHRLPKNIDIIVHCASGGRSANASKFLTDSGYTRVFNMLGGFNNWPYENRTSGFGDHSGHWVRSTISGPDTVKHDSATLVFYPSSVAAIDSLYCEVHFAYGKQPVPADAPQSNIGGLFRLTILNRFGLTLFGGDSLALADTTGITLVPRSKDGGPVPSLLQTSVTALAGPGQWKSQNFIYQFPSFRGNTRTLRQWYNASGIYPGSTHKHPMVRPFLSLSENSGELPMVYDLRGRLLAKGFFNDPVPVISSCGYYIIDTRREPRCGTPSIDSRFITTSSHRSP